MGAATIIARGAPESRASLRDRTVSGIAWGTAGRLGQQAAGFGTSVVLARLLLPEDFGLVAMVAVFGDFAAILVDAGIGDALVQRKTAEPSLLDSAFFLAGMLGIAASLALFLGAPALAALYAAPALEPACRAIAWGFTLGALGTVPRALLRRRMDFRALAAADFTAMAVRGVVAIALAAAGAGIWSLVASSLAGTAGATAVLRTRCTWRPGAAPRIAALGEMIRLGGGLLGFNLVNYWARNLDNLLVGRMLGATALGVYVRAYYLMLLPIYLVTSVSATALLPALSSIQEDRPRVKAIYLRSMGVVALVVAPMVTGLFVVADRLIPAVYGENWRGVVPVLRLLCVAGLVQAFCNPVGWIYASQGRTGLMFRWGVFGSAVQVAAIGMGAWGGTLPSIAGAYAASCVVLFYPCVSIPGRLIDLTFRELIRSIAGAIACALAMGLLVRAVAWPMAGRAAWTILAVQVGVGATSYWAMVRTLGVEAYLDLAACLGSKGGRR